MATEQVLEGRVAIVTGSASGIGRRTALTFGNAGAKVILADLNLEGAKAVAAEIEELGSDALPVQTNVSRWNDVSNMVDQCLTRFGKVDILVNDAGISAGGSLGQLTEADWDRVLGVNLKGAMFCCKTVVPHMQQQQSGVIVNISSGSGFRPSGMSLAYGCSKAAIAHLSRSLAYELGIDNIRVNTVAPGLTDTPMTRKNWPTYEELVNRATESYIQNPMHIVLEPQDLANAVLFLTSDAARYITGQTLHVNGGSWLS